MVLNTRYFANVKEIPKDIVANFLSCTFFRLFLAYCVAFSQAKLNEYVFIFYIIGQDIDNTSKNTQNFPYGLPRILVQFLVCV